MESPRYDAKKAQVILAVLELAGYEHCDMKAHEENRECFGCFVGSAAHSISECGDRHKWFDRYQAIYERYCKQ